MTTESGYKWSSFQNKRSKKDQKAMALPLTPSDSPEFQKSHPIKPEDEFIVMFDRPHGEAFQTLKDVFNRHGRGHVSRVLTGVFWVQDIDWPIVNELRNRKDIRCCGPTAKGPGRGF
jgi:hypothetical protein